MIHLNPKNLTMHGLTGYSLVRKLFLSFAVAALTSSASLAQEDTVNASHTVWQGSIANDPKVKRFVHKMVQTHGFSERRLLALFEGVEANHEVLHLIRPKNRAENQPSWQQYRQRFLVWRRIDQGKRFWRRYATTLKAASARYGVPAEIIVAIIGVETAYGRITGRFGVLESLATLAFYYPRRSPFFTSELENFLLLCRENQMSPNEVKGSFAGAMGIPQFMPSSQRRHAVDFDDDGKIDLRYSPTDAIGSVASFLVNHGWKPGEAVALRTETGQNTDVQLKRLTDAGNKPSWSMKQLAQVGVHPAPSASVGDDLNTGNILPSMASLMAFPTPDEATQYWLGFENFYVLTRYNRANFYALATFQLAERLAMEMK